VRPDKPGEPDFILEDKDGKPAGFAEVKTPRDPATVPRTLAQQAADVAPKINNGLNQGFAVIVDLKYLSPGDKITFLNELRANGVDTNKIIILNR
jgi:hypothetical protein